MAETRVAVRYAKAILNLALEQNTAETIDTDMKLIANTINQNSELSDMLQNPVLNFSVKKTALLAIFKTINPMTVKLIDLLIANKRLTLLNVIAQKYTVLFDTKKNIATATVTTAVPLSEQMEATVLAKAKTFTTKTITLKNNINSAIIGGFILRIGDIQYDASVVNQLNKLKKEFTLN